jgi:hypothetical protein
MEPFVYLSTGKKLPGKHGQQVLIAALPPSRKNSQAVIKQAISNLARLSLCVWRTAGLGEPGGSTDPKTLAWEGDGSDHATGENHRWRMPFSSDFHGR